MDAEAFRAENRARWEESADGWARTRAAIARDTTPVSQWLLEAARLQPGMIVLEVASGPGDLGLLAAEIVAPAGRAIVTDGAEAMVEVARARGAELGIANAEFRQMEAEWLDLEAASVDAVLCRWGYMLLADPEAALRETRRVLRPGGHVALAVWDVPERNPWMSAAGRTLTARGVMEPPDPEQPGPFALAAPGRLRELLDDAGFGEVTVEAVDFEFRAPNLDEWWEQMLKNSSRVRSAMAALAPAEHYATRDAVDAAYAPYVQPDGSVRLPARTLVAAAEA